MSFEVIEFNGEIDGHWGLCVGVIKGSHHHSHWHGKLDNAVVERVWRNWIGPDNYFYRFHIKSGYFPEHHHFTVNAQCWEGEWRILGIVEGHDTVF